MSTSTPGTAAQRPVTAYLPQGRFGHAVVEHLAEPQDVVLSVDHGLVYASVPYADRLVMISDADRTPVREALDEVDAVLFCLPADQRIGPGDQFIARELRGVKRPVIAVATKCDAVARERVMKHLLAIEKLGEWAAIVPVSSVEGKGIDHLRDVLAQTVPLSPPLYPEGDVTDESRDTLIAEFIREAALEGVRDELPHSLAVQVEEIIERERREGDTRPPLVDVHVNVYVERDSQKAIIIGRRGARLKEIGTEARRHIEELLGKRVYLDLHVRTAKDWQSDPKMLGRLGF